MAFAGGAGGLSAGEGGSALEVFFEVDGPEALSLGGRFVDPSACLILTYRTDELLSGLQGFCSTGREVANSLCEIVRSISRVPRVVEEWVQ